MSAWRHLVVFKLDGQSFALRLAVVARIERAVEITPLAKMPENVLGVVNLQGQIIPVFNVRRRFGLPERDVDPHDQLIFAHIERRPVALLVDAVGETIEIDDRDLIATDGIIPGLECVRGVAKVAGGLVLIHDLDRFLSSEEEQALAEVMRRA